MLDVLVAVSLAVGHPGRTAGSGHHCAGFGMQRMVAKNAIVKKLHAGDFGIHHRYLYRQDRNFDAKQNGRRGPGPAVNVQGIRFPIPMTAVFHWGKSHPRGSHAGTETADGGALCNDAQVKKVETERADRDPTEGAPAPLAVHPPASSAAPAWPKSRLIRAVL